VPDVLKARSAFILKRLKGKNPHNLYVCHSHQHVSSNIITPQQHFQQIFQKGRQIFKSWQNTNIQKPRWQQVGNKAAVFPSAVDKHQLRWSTSIIFSTDETHSPQQKWNGGKILAFH